MKHTLPELPHNRGNRGIGAMACSARCTAAPLICLALAVALATNALLPCLGAAGLAGAAAILAATMVALFAVLLAIVSVSVAAAIATHLLSPPAANAAGIGGAIATTVPADGRNGPYDMSAALPGGAPPPAATLQPLSREPP